MQARVKNSSLGWLSSLESEGNGIDNGQVPESPDFKSLVGQVDKLESELESERRKSAEQINRMKYLQADLVNLQRQTDRLISDARNETKLVWIMEIISIKEDLGRALQSTSEKSVLTDGLKLLETRIENDLKTDGVETIKVEVGIPFDTKFHEAVGYLETDKENEGSVIAVIANGYTIDGRVVRPALVEVAKSKRAHGKEPTLNERAVGEKSD